MMEYSRDINTYQEEQYDPFLSRVMRHKRARNYGRSGRFGRNAAKRRLLQRSLGLSGQRRARSRRRPVRVVSSRYRKPKPLRNTLGSKPKVIKHPIGRPVIPFGDPRHRDMELHRGNTNKKVIPVKPGDPRNRKGPPILVSNPSPKQKKESRDIILPYERSYGKGRPKQTVTNTIDMPPEEVQPMVTQELTTGTTMQEQEQTPNPTSTNDRRKMKNIIGITVIGLLVTGFVVYRMKSKLTAHGHTR